MSRIIKKQQPIQMIESQPSYNEPVENHVSRLHQQQKIINELDLIKARVDQVLL